MLIIIQIHNISKFNDIQVDYISLFLYYLNYRAQIPLPCEIHIYIDSESLRQIYYILTNVEGVGILVIDTSPKWRFVIWPFLWFFGD